MQKFSLEYWKKEIKRFHKSTDPKSRDCIGIALSAIEQRFGTEARNAIILELGLDKYYGFEVK